jgi:hypothetical protein
LLGVAVLFISALSAARSERLIQVLTDCETRNGELKSFSEHLAQAQFRQLHMLFVNGKHWVTVSNIHTGPPNEIHIYDSKPPNYDQFSKHQVAGVLRQNAPEIRLSWPPICLQPNDNDCGCYAVAASVALADSEKPQTQNLKNEVSQSCSLTALGKQF